MSKEEESLFVAKKAFEDGFYDVSLGLLERFLKNYPESPKIFEAKALAGQCYYYQARFLDALNEFEALVKQPLAKDIKDACLYWIAEVHFKANNFPKAAEYYQQVVDNFPKSSYAVSAYYSLGWCLFQEGQFSEAMRYFGIAEERYPKEPVAQDASFKIIECLYNLKDYTTLAQKLKNYLKTFSRDSARLGFIYFYLGEAYYYLSDFSQAAAEYTKAVSAKPEARILALSRLGMAWANLKLKKYKEAKEQFLEVRSEDLEKPSRDILLLGKAALAWETANYEEARALYEELENTTQDELVLLQAYLGEGDCFYNLSLYKEAIAIYKKAAQKVSAGTPAEILDKLHYAGAWAYLKEGEFKNAIDEFQKIARLSEDRVVKVAALCQIGDTYQDSGDYQRAADTYDTILKDYPDSFYSDYTQYQLGATLLKASKYDAAGLIFKKLIDSYPNSKLRDDAAYSLGLVYFQKEDYGASAEVFQKFDAEFKESASRPQATYLLGTSLYNLGRYAEAIEVFKNVARQFGQDSELVQKAEYEIADCFYQMGNEEEAMSRFKALRARYPDSALTAEVVWWLGEYYYRNRQLNLSRRYFSSLIQDFPQSSLVPGAYYTLGGIAEEESNLPEALENFKKVTALGRTELAATAAVAIGDIHVKLQQFDTALKIYKETVAANAQLAGLIYPKIGDVYERRNNYAEAANYYRQSLDLVPVGQVSVIQFKIAESLQAEGKKNEAIEEYLKVTYLYAETNELAVKSLLRAGAIYEDMARYKEAQDIYKKVAAMNVEEARFAKERIEAIKERKK